MPLGPGRAAPQVRGLQRRRDGARQHQGPLPAERNPHLLIEGMLCRRLRHAGRRRLHLPARAVRRALRHVEQALAEAAAAGYLGEHILGSDFSLRPLPARERRPLHLRRGLGDAQRAREPAAQPARAAAAHDRRRPVRATRRSSTTSRRSAPCRRSCATASTGGRACRLAARAAPRSTASPGRVQRPGCVELPMGTSMRELIEVHAGGMQPRLRAARRQPRRRLHGVRPRRPHRRGHGLHRHGDRPAAAWAPARSCCSTTRPAPSA